MSFKSKQIRELINATQDHLEILDSEVVLVNGPSFKDSPVTMVAKMQHTESKLTYNQLFKMSSNTAQKVRDRIDDSISNLDQLEDS